MTAADGPPPPTSPPLPPRAAAARRFAGGFTLDLARGALLDPSGAELPLRPKSFALLRLLVEHAGRLLDRDAILDAVWPGVFVTDDSITQCVRDVRKALGDEAGRLLRTVPKRGYLLATKVAALTEPTQAGPATALASGAARRLAAVLLADVVGYSRLMGRDEPGALARLNAAREGVLEPLVAAHRGRVVNRAGDGALCEFPSVVEAVACAVAVQRAMAGREPDLPEAERLRFRIGVNLGDVIAEGAEIYGDGVNVAARLEALAEPGGVCVSGKVREEVRGKLDGLAFEDLGERALKNIARPVRAWRVAAGSADAAPQETAAVLSPAADHNLPQPNPAFVGRAAELEALARALAATGRGTITQTRHAVSGLGGVGKTQLALAYAYAHLGEYDLVRWLRAEEPATLAADYAGLAPALGLDPAAAPDRAALLAAVRGRLERAGGRWLLVFDNATGPSTLEAYLPRTGAGHVLVTSRWREWEGTAAALELEALPEAEAVALLLGGEGNEAGDADDPARRAEAPELARELGRLPLALAQARAFMRARRVGVAGYREQLAAARPKVLAWRPPAAAYPLAVAQAWQASLDQAARDCPAAEGLLRLLAFLAPEAVPRDLLGAAPDALPEGLRDPFDRDTAVEALGRYSLARVEPDSLTVHRLVQAVTRDGLRAATAGGCAELAVRLVDAALPRPLSEHAHRPAVGRLLPHALAAAEAAERLGVGLAAAGAVLNDVGTYLRAAAAWSEAEPPLRRALALRERIVGPEHPDVAESLFALANLYHDTERLAEAEPLYERALAIRERALGPEHPDLGDSLSCLGTLYHDTGRPAEAEPLLRRAVTLRERILGPEHPDLAMLLNHLGVLCRDTGRPAEAEPLLRRALAIAERTLDPEHPFVATLLSNLGRLYLSTGRPAEAEPLFVRALAVCEQALGPDHPDLAGSLNQLALLYRDTERPAEAESLLYRALALRERIFGPEHLVPCRDPPAARPAMNAAEACALLGAAGFRVAPRDIRVEAREGCWAVALPGGRMAWFPMGEEGRRRLATERRVLRLLAERCSFRVPRVLHEAEAGWDVRALVPGAFDPRGLYERIRADRDLARRLGRAIGGVLAEQHARVRHQDVAGWLPETMPWPAPIGWMRERLPAVVDDPLLLAAIERALRRYEDQEAAAAAGEGVLVHGNIGIAQLAVDPATGELVGVFEYGEPAWADRHHDFRYLVFGDDDESVLDGALEVYEPATGVRIDRPRVRLCNAACAISYLAFRRGVPPEAFSCGRTLEEDLRWTRAALAAAGIDPA